MGNQEFLYYNLLYPLHPVRLSIVFLRRLYYLGFANLHWVGTLAVAAAVWRTEIFKTRSWRIAGTLLAAHVILVTVLGGAALNRYLLPVLPIVYTAMAASIDSLRRAWRIAATFALAAGLAAGNLINPPYPCAWEDNLALADFLHLHQRAARELQQELPGRAVTTVWPLTMELQHPELGFVTRPIASREISDFSLGTLSAIDWDTADVFVIYSRDWSPALNLLHLPPLARFWSRYFGYIPHATRAQARSCVPLRLISRFESRGQWIDIYAR